jgi:NAD(P)-dependent dehydrogenase (short-subunit alcohol dehydrogenase family)
MAQARLPPKRPPRSWPPTSPGTGITANVLVPGGMTDTRIVPQSEVSERHRLLRPEIMVPPLLWLLSGAARHITARRLGHHSSARAGRGKMRRTDRLTNIGTMPIEPN